MTSTTASAATETFACDCKICHGAAITAPVGYITAKTPKALRDMVHNYVVAAHTPAGIGRMMADRAGIKAA